MKLISKEEVEFIVIQLIDKGRFEEADALLAQNKMTGAEWYDLKTMRYQIWNPESLD